MVSVVYLLPLVGCLGRLGNLLSYSSVTGVWEVKSQENILLVVNTYLLRNTPCNCHYNTITMVSSPVSWFPGQRVTNNRDAKLLDQIPSNGAAPGCGGAEIKALQVGRAGGRAGGRAVLVDS